ALLGGDLEASVGREAGGEPVDRVDRGADVLGRGVVGEARGAGVRAPVEVDVDADLLEGSGGGVADVDEEAAVLGRVGEGGEGGVGGVVQGPGAVGEGDLEGAAGGGHALSVGAGGVDAVGVEDEAGGDGVEAVDGLVDGAVAGAEQPAQGAPGDGEGLAVGG